MIDPLGLVLTAIRDDPAVAAITTRVRGGELATDDGPPAVVLRRLGTTRAPMGGGTGRAGLEGVTIAALCFAQTYQGAAALYGAVSDAIHMKGPRHDGAGRLIYLTVEESGGDPVVDPDTRWLTETCVISVIAAAKAVGF